MPIPPTGRTAPPRAAVPGPLMVARDSVGLGLALQESFAAKGRCTVVVDQRRADRRRPVQPVLEERRRTERRRLPSLAADLRRWPYVVVRPSSHRPLA
jgi:NAD(P)-dependent dehydrogenase (short-subunit alcohol dehydrogenase family)